MLTDFFWPLSLLYRTLTTAETRHSSANCTIANENKQTRPDRCTQLGKIAFAVSEFAFTVSDLLLRERFAFAVSVTVVGHRNVSLANFISLATGHNNQHVACLHL